MSTTTNLPAISDEFCLKEFGWSKNQFEVIHRMYFKNMNYDQISVFGLICKKTGLDPFVRQIYPIVRSGVLCCQTGIDGYRVAAERTGKYSPGREPTYKEDDKGRIISATAYVKKMTHDGTWHEVSATAFFDEYNPGVGPFWKKMPHTMIAKCAEALALRKAFPDFLAGVYTKEEMDQAGPEDKLPISECEDVTNQADSPKQTKQAVAEFVDRIKMQQSENCEAQEQIAPSLKIDEHQYLAVLQAKAALQDETKKIFDHKLNELGFKCPRDIPVERFEGLMNWINILKSKEQHKEAVTI